MGSKTPFLHNFYPGPSQVHADLGQWIQEGLEQQIAGINHRSLWFMEMYEEIRQLFRANHHLPEGYEVLFVSSATEVWEILSQSWVRKHATHFVQGAFGKKWAEVAQKLGNQVEVIPVSHDSVPAIERLRIQTATELLALTHTETSHGLSLPNSFFESVRQKYPQIPIAIDATSAMGGVQMPWHLADFWYASVQKCWGLAAGLGILIVSPKIIDEVKSRKQNTFYNSLYNLLINSSKNQTTHTPNVLNIYLLKKVLETQGDIRQVEQKILKRADRLRISIEEAEGLSLLSPNAKLQSPTVFCVRSQDSTMWKSRALSQGILLGEGYSGLKNNTFRIANFPAISDESMKVLLRFLST